MTNTVVTSTTNAVKFVFNDDSPLAQDRTAATFSLISIEAIIMNGTHVDLDSSHELRVIFDYAANTMGFLVVDSVNGVTPTSLADLYSKLSALIE